MKVLLHVVLVGPAGVPHDIEVPYTIVTKDNVKECTGNTATAGCNVFPDGTVGDEETADIFNPMLPEASLTGAHSGAADAGAIATAYTAEYLAGFEQDPSRRFITRAACPSGWVEGDLPENVKGCVKG